MADDSIHDLSKADADLCLRVANQMEQRQSRDKADRLIIRALRYLAAAVTEHRS